MNKDVVLSIERLDNRCFLSANPWYVDAIKADLIWSSIGSLSNKPVVAIVDSGVDLSHSALVDNLWHNPYEKVDGIDNDNNGYVDDIVGWDFAENDNSPQDGFFHGTHVAGIVDSVSNNNVDLMILKFQDSGGVGYTGAAVSAINYAVAMKNRGINVAAINCSFGGLDYNSTLLSNSIQYASDNNIVVVLAAGNNGVDTDISPKYPGSLSFANTITVGAINPDLSLAGYSNYGKNTVTVVAPGSDILSTLPNNSYGYVSGTSMAAPMVSGTVGLLKTLGNYTATQIKNVIMQGCEVVGDWIDKIRCGLINVSKSFELLKQTQPYVETKPDPVVPVLEQKLVYAVTIASKKMVSGWASVTNSSNKPVVEIYINNVLRYSVVANSYSAATKSYNGFSVSLNTKFFTKKKNLVEVRIKDSNVTVVAYKNYISR